MNLRKTHRGRFLLFFFFFFITLKPRVEGYAKSMSLKYEPASEPLHIFVKLCRGRFQVQII